MKFLVDVCCGHVVAEWLNSQDHDVVEVGERDCRMSDKDVLNWANSEERIVVTMDMDFSELFAFHNKKHSGIIRLENLPSDFRIKNLSTILMLHKEDLSQKVMIIQRGNKLRIIR